MAASSTLPEADKFSGWHSGRYWLANRPAENQGGMLIVRRDGDKVKIGLLISETTRLREWFDVLGDSKRATINDIRSRMEPCVLPARVVDDALASIISATSNSNRTFEYQYRRTATGFVARAFSFATGTPTIAFLLTGTASTR